MATPTVDREEVINLTNMTQTLHSSDGDSCDVPPHATVFIMRKFIEWVTPSPNKIKIKGYDAHNNPPGDKF